MSTSERTRPYSNKEARDRLNPKEALLRVCTPDFAASNILAITADFIKQHNIHALFLDAEGTFVNTWGTRPQPQLAEHLRKLKAELLAENYPFATVIVTNKKIGNLAAFTATLHWTHEINADLALSPLFPNWRKPKPHMIELGSKQLGIPPDQILMAGDKLTGDIAAGMRAGAKTFYVEEMVGDADLLGDKLFRRPLENEIYSQVKDKVVYLSGPDLKTVTDGGTSHDESAPLFEPDVSWWDPQWKDSDTARLLFSLPNVIYGYGIPFDDSQQKTWGSRNLYIHGGQIADILTESRVPLSILAAVARYKGHKKTANALQGVAEATDLLDGAVVRRSKRGPSKEGAQKDRDRDKTAARIRRTSLVVANKLTRHHAMSRTLADETMNIIGDGLKRNEVVKDTSSVWPGKIATAGESTLDVIVERIAVGHPHFAEFLNTTATLGKIGRIGPNTHLWHERHRLRKMEELHLGAIAAELLAAA